MVTEKGSLKEASLSTDTHTHTHTTELKRTCPLKAGRVEQFCKGLACAWFDAERDMCAVVSLVRELSDLYDWEHDRS